MFRSRRNENPLPKLSSSQCLYTKNKKYEEDPQLPTKSKKCKKKKNFFQVLHQKINIVFDSRSRGPFTYKSNAKSLSSKSFEVLTSSFEEIESPDKAQLSEDIASKRNSCLSKPLHSRPSRNKHTVCPEECPVQTQTITNSSHPTLSTQNRFQQEGAINVFSTQREDADSNLVLDCSLKPNLGLNSGCEQLVEGSAVLSPESNTDVLTPPVSCSSNEHGKLSSTKSCELKLVPKLHKQLNAKSSVDASGCGNLFRGSPQCQGSKVVENRSLAKEIKDLSKYGWYWGPLNRSEAEEKLSDQENGAFLVRDSSDVKYLLSLSFRSYGKTLHTRIEHNNGWFSFYPQPDHDSYRSVVELISHCISESDEGVFCYSRPLLKGSPSFPVRLTKPVSRFMQVRSLQYLCRFVIRQYTSINHIQTLPLPPKIKGYLEENYFK